MLERRRYRALPLNRRRSQRRATRLSGLLLVMLVGSGLLLTAFRAVGSVLRQPVMFTQRPVGQIVNRAEVATGIRQIQSANGRPNLAPLPLAEEVWECEVVVIGGTLGGVAAASYAMKSGVTTCTIELTPWLGGAN